MNEPEPMHQAPAEAVAVHAEVAGALAGRRRAWQVAIMLSLCALTAGLVAHYKTPDTPPAAAAVRDASLPTAVRVAGAAREDIALTGLHTGELDADTTEVAAQAPGLLREVRVRIGDRVKQGELLARIDARHLQQQVAEAAAQVRVAEAAERRAAAHWGSARAELERTQPLLEDHLVSPQELDSLRAQVDSLAADRETAAAQREQGLARMASLRMLIQDARLVAPFDGAISERYINPGSTVQAGTPIVRIVRSGPLRVRFRIPERDLARVEPGKVFHVTTQATAARRFKGAVTHLSAEVSRADRTIAVEGLLDEETRALRPGMYAQVHVVYGTLTDAVTVPSSAIQTRRDAGGVAQSGVYRVVDGHAQWHETRVLGQAGARTAVSGIDAGDSVVTRGAESLRDGAAVRVVEES